MTPQMAQAWRNTRLFAASVFTLCAVLLVAVAAYVFTHRWRYDHEGRFVVRTDTWSGRSQALYPRDGWKAVP